MTHSGACKVSVSRPDLSQQALRLFLASNQIEQITLRNSLAGFDPFHFLAESISHPPTLRKITISGIFCNTTYPADTASLSSDYPNLISLTFDLACFLCARSPPFLLVLGQASLQELSLGIGTRVKSCDILEFVEQQKARSIPTLKRLDLDHFSFMRPSYQVLNAGGYRVEWDDDTKMQEIRKIRELARAMGIEFKGSSFEALEFAESDEYQELVALEEEAAWTDVEEEEDERVQRRGEFELLRARGRRRIAFRS